MARILIVDDERSMREFLEIFLHKEGHDVTLAEDGTRAIGMVEREEFDLCITDLKLGKVSGLEVLAAIKARNPEVEVVVITAFGTNEVHAQAIKLGAYHYLAKPFKLEEMSVVVQAALQRRALVRENQRLARALGERAQLGNLIGRSAAITEVVSLIEKVVPTRTTVLITGESGTGKELVARAIHHRSPRASSPFVAINCGAIPEGLIESELFGHVKGAFTGAVAAKPGLFEAAQGGTVFLDEIGELPAPMQVKLLRVLQDRAVRRVGGVEDVAVDARLLAATNRDLAADVRAGRFREDLYYRLNVIQIKVPPLRERREDVLPLAEHFLRKYAAEVARPPMTLSRAARGLLADYSFPGNVRELENLIERAVTLAEGAVVEPAAFPASVRAPAGIEPPMEEAFRPGFSLQARLDEVERAYLEKALQQGGGVKKEAARLLGLTFRSLRYRLAKLGILSADSDDEPAPDRQG